MIQTFRSLRVTAPMLPVLRRLFSCVMLGVAFLIASPRATAVLLFSTADPSANTTEPTGALTGSGWQYEASFGPFLATAIGPNHFITVKHIGNPSNMFIYRGASYTITQSFDDPMSDLRIFQVAETVPNYATLYSRSDEQGQNIVVIGRGTQRGNPIYLSGILRGWEWGIGDQVQRWGENKVSSANGNSLYATFDQNAGPNEAHLSSGDSGGAVFINNAGVWKLAGINLAVDGPFSTTSGGAAFNAAFFDARGFYDSAAQIIPWSGPAPTGFYAVRISNRLPWIQNIIFPGTPLPSPTPTPRPAPTPRSTPTPTPVPIGTPPPGPAQMLSPVPGGTLSSSVTTFNWTAGGTGKYWLLVGTSPGTSNIYNSGTLNVNSITVNNLPKNGSTIYVRLTSVVRKGKRLSVDYTYNAYRPASTPSRPK